MPVRYRSDWLRLDLGRHEHVTAVSICIEEIYVGTKFPTDVCISEVMWVCRVN